MTLNGSVSQKWLIGILTTIVLAGGAGWMGYVHTQIDAMAADQKKQQEGNVADQKKQQETNAENRRETAVIKEKVERLEKDVGEIKGEQKEQSKKLDELLRRVR